MAITTHHVYKKGHAAHLPTHLRQHAASWIHHLHRKGEQRHLHSKGSPHHQCKLEQINIYTHNDTQIQHPDQHERQERDWTSPSRPDEQRLIEKEMKTKHYMNIHI